MLAQKRPQRIAEKNCNEDNITDTGITFYYGGNIFSVLEQHTNGETK